MFAVSSVLHHPGSSLTNLTITDTLHCIIFACV